MDVVDEDDHYATAVAEAQSVAPELAIVGRLAKPTPEGWVLATSGQRGTDEWSKAKAVAALAHCQKSTVEYVTIVAGGSLAYAKQAPSLAAWLEAAAAALATR